MTNRPVDAAETPAIDRNDGRLAIPLLEAARMLSLGRAAAYEAAHTGQIPTIRIGKKFLVPVAALSRLLTVGIDVAAKAVVADGR